MELKVPVIGILRGVESSFFGELMQVSFASGLQAIEVTMNTAQAEEILSRYRPMVPEGKYLGAGTVRNLQEAKRACDAGAMYFVTPNLDLSVIAFARDNRIPIIAGALTPTEVYSAWSEGADMVKVFPCSSLGGPQYIRELAGPFEQIPMVAVGGVSLDNAGEYLAAGVKAVGVFTSLFGSEAVKRKDLKQIGVNVGNFVRQSLKEVCIHS